MNRTLGSELCPYHEEVHAHPSGLHLCLLTVGIGLPESGLWRRPATAAPLSQTFPLPRSVMWIGRRQLRDSFMEVCATNFSAARKPTPVSTRYWSIAGVDFAEISATLPAVTLQVPMSGLEKAVPKVDSRLTVFKSQWPAWPCGLRFDAATTVLTVPVCLSDWPLRFRHGRAQVTQIAQSSMNMHLLLQPYLDQ